MSHVSLNRLVTILCTAIVLQSCASWLSKNEAAPPEEPPPVTEVIKTEEAPVAVVDEEPLTKFSDINNMAPPSDRQYKRMTRQKMEEESALFDSAGSLWKMDGQSSFLFAENKHRRPGDPTAIKVEGSALKLIESKVAVIQDLLAQLEEQKKKFEEEAVKSEEEKSRLAIAEEEKKLREEQMALSGLPPLNADQFYAPEPAPPKREPAAVKPVVVAKEEKVDLKELDMIPSKIVEKLEDGIYRIRGQQFLTIKKKPYKVIATALIRAEDFNDLNVSSNKLLDAQYDVIHVKRTAE